MRANASLQYQAHNGLLFTGKNNLKGMTPEASHIQVTNSCARSYSKNKVA